MFGISFTELLLVGLVALLVLGPERLPGAARTAGLWVGRLKRSFNAIKQEVEREIGADEIRRQLHNEHILSLEQEARKILAPQQQTPSTFEPVTEQSTPAPAQLTTAVEPVPAVTSVSAAEPSVGPTATETVSPAPAPSAPAPLDPTLPPRAP